MANNTKQRAFRQSKPSAKKTVKRAVKPAAKKSTNRGPSTRVVHDRSVFGNATWTVCYGELKKPVKTGPKPKNEPTPLFAYVGEKLPYGSLRDVKQHIHKQVEANVEGVYVAHDSMGCARYVGRGRIFQRLEARKRARPLELEYFSFYVVDTKYHQREVETLLIRASGFLLEFNSRKKRVGIESGDVRDYEPGTRFYERQHKKGRKAASAPPAA